MIQHRRMVKTVVSLVVLVACLFGNKIFAQANGQALFSANCASCHAINKDLTGPALAGVEQRWGGDKKKLHAWIHNNQAFLKTGDKYANDLYLKYNKTQMNLFPSLTDAEIDAILGYIKTVPPPNADTGGGAGAAAASGGEDNSLLYGILTLILAVVALILLQVNSNLKKLSDEKEGISGLDPVPFWRNKTYIALVAIVLFCVGGFLLAKGAIGLGRTKGYQPEQPIYYSHKVHAGTNQISCLYCHGGAQDGKHANIPSVNICMNCHMAINEYTGKDKLIKEDGTEVDGSAEIKKLYKYAGFDPAVSKVWNPNKAKPIEWNRIHNLPDHVYFNHSQHVKAGKVQCQTCHGEIQKMDVAKQFAELSMGWCIGCHRSTQVQFKDNGFYSIYQKFHDDLKNGRLDSTKGITVEKIGGTECQRCHY